MKKILINMSDLKEKPTCGFAQIAKNYRKHFTQLKPDYYDFFFWVKKEMVNKNPPVGIHYIPIKHFLFKKIKIGIPKVDLWHNVNQNQKFAKLNKNTKFIYTVHDLNFLFEKSPLKQKKYLARMQKWVDKATFITTISKYTADVMRQNINLRGKEIKVIYNGVEDITQTPQHKPSFVSEKPFFFAIGQVRAKKNFHLLVKMMKNFPDYNLFIAGDNHFGYAQSIREDISNENINNAFLVGKISDEERAWLYANCQAYLFPSIGEGFGLPAIEAMQFGKAVYISNSTCLPEICNNHAIIWNKLNPSDMASVIKQTLEKFYSNPLNITSEKEYATTFSYEKHIKAYLQLYDEALNMK